MTSTNKVLVDNATLAQMDVDALLEMDIDSMEEVADFVAMPTASYRFSVGSPEIAEVGKDNKKAIKVPFSLTAIVELADPTNTEDVDLVTQAFADGKTVDHTEVFMLESKNVSAKSAYGVRAFATIFKKLLADGETANVAQLMELAAGTSGEAMIERSSYTPEGSTELKYSSRMKPTAVFFD